MRKFVGLRKLSHVLQRTVRNEVMSPAHVLKKYCTGGTEICKDVRIVPMESQGSLKADDILLKDLVKDLKVPRALDLCDGDMSDFAPYHKPSFNFAAYANKSETIQELVKLGVELWKIETQVGAMEIILSKNFDDMKPYIQFLHDCGVPADRISVSITKNPFIFKEDLDDLKTRIRYLRAHNFGQQDIAHIVSEAPKWLSWRTDEIDNKLAYFQREFELTGQEVRALVLRRPQLITSKLRDIRDNTFAVREEMGFEEEEIKAMLLNMPRIWERARYALVAAFDYVHNVMKIPHELIAQQPIILLTRFERLKNRHLFLVSLKRAQYDPKKPLYIPLRGLASGTDFEFCLQRAKCSVELYDMFLKTM